MATFIIADLHLSLKRQDLFLALSNFYKRLNSNDRLFILGDFFDFFVGIDRRDPLYLKIQELILLYKERGISTFFQCGNRDFLINAQAANFFNFSLLPDLYIEDTKEGKALFLHGDALCVNDPAFQRFRKFSKNKVILALFMALPFWLRKKIGSHIREKSRNLEPIRTVAAHEQKLIHKEAQRLLTEHHCQILIHGHFHIFADIQKAFGPQSRRLGLGSWDKNYSYIKIDEHGLTMRERPLSELL